jgi:arylsulfatase A-like enzyme
MSFLKLYKCLSVLLIFLTWSCSVNEDLKKPNIVIFICDQLNPDALSCYKGPVATPNIDKLADNGLIFNNAVCPYPVCSPSRASLVLGTYPHDHGIVHNCNAGYPEIRNPHSETEEGITNADLTIDRILYEAGYNTMQYGKWHLKGEDLGYFKEGYDEHSDYKSEMAEFFNATRNLPEKEWMNWYGWILPVDQTEEFQAAVNKASPEFLQHQYSDFITKTGRLRIPLESNFDVRVADKVIEAIEGSDNKPFILTCSFNYPHDPNVVPDPYYSMFNPDSIQLPVNYHDIDPYFYDTWSNRMVNELEETGVREFLRNYYASIKLIDDQVGRVLHALKSKGLFDNTIIIFTADHGDMMGSHRMIWKSNHSFYDEVVRIPMIIYYPEHIKPGTPDFPINLTDIPTTLLGLTGHTIPEQMTGNNLTPFILGEKHLGEAPKYVLSSRIAAHPEHKRTMEAGRPGNFMIRGNGWKYIRYHDGHEYLYDLKNDPSEISNLANDIKYQGKKKEMGQELTKLLKDTNYKF